MNARRIRNFRDNINRSIVDDKIDRFFETGRQFVDGVSGTRPGSRRNADFKKMTSRNAKKVGRWVSEKVDLFFDDDNDLLYDNEDLYYDIRDTKTFKKQSNSRNVSQSFSKRPLEALSLRQPRNIQIGEQKKLPYSRETNYKDWPDEDDFTVERWHRSSEKDSQEDRLGDKERIEVNKVRNLPRSRRRRI